MQLILERILALSNAWSFLINNIQYVMTGSTVCLIWHKNFAFNLNQEYHKEYMTVLNIDLDTLDESLSKDVYNFTAKEAQLLQNGVFFDNFIKKLTVAIENSHCEFFVAFQQHIPIFAKAFYNASIYSIWRSTRTHFLFAYTQDNQFGDSYFDDYLFQDQPNILVLEATSLESSEILLKTNRFVGSIYDNPNQLILVDRYNTTTAKFELNRDLFADKITDLQGREVIIGAFDYRPFVVLDFDASPKMYDYAEDNLNHEVKMDGTEVRTFLTFCELYNCTVQGDTCEYNCYAYRTEKGEWGAARPNVTADGLIGNIIKRRIHVGIGAMYSWYVDYTYLDLTTFLGRSGVTCMVPAPGRRTSWYLPLKPFQYTLWLAVAGCLLLETISLLFTYRFEQSLARMDSSWLTSFQFGYIITLKLFISQGSDYVVSSITVRTVLLACYMIDMILTSIYSGGLAAVLTIPTYDEAPDSVERLHKFGLEWAGSSIVWTEGFRHDPDPIAQDLFKHFTVSSQEELTIKAYTENIGLVVERMTYNHFANVDPLTAKSIGRYKLMIDDIYYQWSVAFVPKLWAFLSKYNNMIYNIHSSGFDKYWEWKMTADYLNANIQQQMVDSQFINPDTEAVPFDMANFAGVIVIWVAGMTISVLGFITELFYFKYYNVERHI